MESSRRYRVLHADRRPVRVAQALPVQAKELEVMTWPQAFAMVGIAWAVAWAFVYRDAPPEDRK